jgi:hypothetical protein
MADSRRPVSTAVRHRDPYDGLDLTNPDQVLTAAARFVDPGYSNVAIFQYERWQDELWDYLETIGEFGFAHWWLAQGISRVRVIAAEDIPGSEPMPIFDGMAADLMKKIDTEDMEAFGLHIPLVGKCFLLNQNVPLMGNQLSVHSADEIRSRRTGMRSQALSILRGRAVPAGRFDLQIEAGIWAPLENALVSEIRHKHPRWGWRSISSSKSAIPILREISLIDKHIIATLVSRLAMNGLLLLPEEMTFPVNPQFKEAPDPFLAEFVDRAGKNIKNPGSAGGAIPFPIRMKGELIDKISHLTFANALDPKIIDARDKAISRLATSMNMSRERITGMGEVNHWGTWEIKDDEITMHIVPPVELIVNSLTETYLRPQLIAAGQSLRGPNGGEIIAWYDAGELAQRPDQSKEAELAYASGNLRRESYIKYMGFEEDDLPSPAELADIILLRQALSPGADPQYFQELTGITVEPVDTGQVIDGSEADQGTQAIDGPPKTRNGEPA